MAHQRGLGYERNCLESLFKCSGYFVRTYHRDIFCKRGLSFDERQCHADRVGMNRVLPLPKVTRRSLLDLIATGCRLPLYRVNNN